MPELLAEQNKVLASTPADELLKLAFLSGEAVPDPTSGSPTNAPCYGMGSGRVAPSGVRSTLAKTGCLRIDLTAVASATRSRAAGAVSIERGPRSDASFRAHEIEDLALQSRCRRGLTLSLRARRVLGLDQSCEMEIARAGHWLSARRTVSSSSDLTSLTSTMA
jgi:hypothetical protein